MKGNGKKKFEEWKLILPNNWSGDGPWKINFFLITIVGFQANMTTFSAEGGRAGRVQQDFAVVQLVSSGNVFA
jgi:hypothetical protein